MNTLAGRSSAVDALSEIGRPEPGDGREYVESFGLTDDDVPALVELAKRWADEAHFEATGSSSAMWGPLHAWRALGELGAEVVVPTLLGILDALDRGGDDWMMEEFPPLCEQIGASVLDPLVAFLLDMTHLEYARGAVAHGLKRIAVAEPDTRDRVCEALASALRCRWAGQPDFNAFLVSYLTDLEGVEYADVIERAFEAGVVSEMVCGDWNDIAFELGLGPRPPRRASMLDLVLDRPPETPDGAPTRKRRPAQRAGKSAQKRKKQARKKNRRR